MTHRPGVLGVVALGGMIGSSARYGIARALPVHPGDVPWATLVTNLAGSFLLGVVLAVVAHRMPGHRYARPFLAGGVLGGFTTMSTFQVETALLLGDGRAATALVYVLVSVAGGTLLTLAGLSLGRRAAPARTEAR